MYTKRISVPQSLSWFLALLILLVYLPTADAFVFDTWQSGMNIEKVIGIGKDKGISVEFSGGNFSLFSKKEPDELAVNVEYQGYTKLMGYDGKLLFTFAPESRVLHTLRVTLTLPISSDKADMEVLADTLAKKLDAKYKKTGEPVAETMLEQLADKLRQIQRRSWNGSGDTVTMESNWKMIGGDLVITYVNDKLAERAVVEDRRIREKRLERSSGGDRNKF
jgi:hypothetical protein